MAQQQTNDLLSGCADAVLQARSQPANGPLPQHCPTCLQGARGAVQFTQQADPPPLLQAIASVGVVHSLLAANSSYVPLQQTTQHDPTYFNTRLQVMCGQLTLTPWQTRCVPDHARHVSDSDRAMRASPDPSPWHPALLQRPPNCICVSLPGPQSIPSKASSWAPPVDGVAPAAVQACAWGAHLLVKV